MMCLHPLLFANTALVRTLHYFLHHILLTVMFDVFRKTEPSLSHSLRLPSAAFMLRKAFLPLGRFEEASTVILSSSLLCLEAGAVYAIFNEITVLASLTVNSIKSRVAVSRRSFCCKSLRITRYQLPFLFLILLYVLR